MNTKHPTAETSAEPQDAKPSRPALPEALCAGRDPLHRQHSRRVPRHADDRRLGALGPLFQYNDHWQLVINTGTTIVTFLMVFLIQRSQNKDALAIHLKLNEIVAALGGASNRLVTAEDLSERDLADLHRHYQQLAQKVRASDPLGADTVEEEETGAGDGSARRGRSVSDRIECRGAGGAGRHRRPERSARGVAASRRRRVRAARSSGGNARRTPRRRGLSAAPPSNASNDVSQRRRPRSAWTASWATSSTRLVTTRPPVKAFTTDAST